MASLTETAYYSRKFIRWGIIAFIAFFVLRISLGLLVDLIRKTFPPPPLKINNAFGKLPKIEFPQIASPSAELTYTFQTLEGTVPQASEAARVYFMPKNKTNLLSLTRAQTLVGQLGFTSNPYRLNDTLYKWLNLTNPLKTVTVDIVNSHFTLKYDFTNDPALFIQNPELASTQQFLFETTTLLGRTSLDIQGIDMLHPKIQFLKVAGSELQLANGQSQANVLRLDFFRKSFTGLPVMTDNPLEGPLTLIYSPSKTQEKHLLLLNYHYWPVNTDFIAAYKLKTSKQAYEELVKREAYFASLPDPLPTQIVITRVYLAYYDSNNPQLYLQPVFVFEGEKNFVAYVPAVTPPWTE